MSYTARNICISCGYSIGHHPRCLEGKDNAAQDGPSYEGMPVTPAPAATSPTEEVEALLIAAEQHDPSPYGSPHEPLVNLALSLAHRLEVAQRDAERERMRLAACGTAALGYHKRGDSIHPDYESASLHDVLNLAERAAKAEAELAEAKRDAGRYRWWCDKYFGSDEELDEINSLKADGPEGWGKAIDAAISAAGGKD